MSEQNDETADGCEMLTATSDPVVLYQALCRATDEIEQLKRERDEVREALEHIVEYWNRDENETSMSDALWHIIQTAVDVLHATKPDQLKEKAK